MKVPTSLQQRFLLENLRWGTTADPRYSGPPFWACPKTLAWQKILYQETSSTHLRAGRCAGEQFQTNKNNWHKRNYYPSCRHWEKNNKIRSSKNTSSRRTSNRNEEQATGPSAAFEVPSRTFNLTPFNQKSLDSVESTKICNVCLHQSHESLKCSLMLQLP